MIKIYISIYLRYIYILKDIINLQQAQKQFITESSTLRIYLSPRKKNCSNIINSITDEAFFNDKPRGQ